MKEGYLGGAEIQGVGKELMWSWGVEVILGFFRKTDGRYRNINRIDDINGR